MLYHTIKAPISANSAINKTFLTAGVKVGVDFGMGICFTFFLISFKMNSC